MRLLLIRHGEPDYSFPEGKGFIGPGRELAPLSARGVDQAEAVALDPRLEGSQLIVSSPYTRSLQTAAIISRVTQLKIAVEFDLHEWLIDTTYENKDMTDTIAAIREISAFQGVRRDGAKLHWEGYDQVAERAYAALRPYLHLDKVIVACHAYIIKQFYNPGRIEHCQIVEVDFDENFTWPGYIERGTRSWY
ncbi:MAG: histidine phosphatase family protein [Chloroflexi bacterium]|jgi:broad specificity phosphatase PhoE|nr:histidine phosphatase family protein [Chloroflexota bacterium]